MDLTDLFDQMPFLQLLGIEITDARDGVAEGTLPCSDDLRSSSAGRVVHGGATYALADSVGGAAVMSLERDITPTIDMRIDYLAPVETDLHASAEVIRHGSSVATVRVDIEDARGTRVATAQGAYKTGGQGEQTPWGSMTSD